jgi:hypothetical protein
MDPYTRASARPATLAEINAVLGTTPRGALSASVAGMTPDKIRCSEILVADRMAMTGHMTTHFIAANGSPTDASLSFVNGDRGTGIYSSAAGIFSAVSGGQVIATIAPAGLGITHLYSPTSVIDFGGATITNIGGMDITNSWSFSVNPTAPVTTSDATPTAILTIPMVPVGPPCDVIYDMRAHVVFASNLAPTSPNGATTFRARIKLLHPAAVPTVSPLYDESLYIDQQLATATVTITPISSAIQITATGIAATSITWTAMCSIVRTEVPR